MEKLGLTLLALASWRDVLAVEGGLQPRARATLEQFLADPVTWSAAHGGRATLAKPAL
jgi:orotate phosphoribosyltransferase